MVQEMARKTANKMADQDSHRSIKRKPLSIRS